MTHRPYTREEVQDLFLEHIAAMVKYWERNGESTKDKLEGLAFSLLVALDGGAMCLPGFLVIPNPHPDDKKYVIDNAGEDDNVKYFPDDYRECDIAGGLHEKIHNYFK